MLNYTAYEYTSVEMVNIELLENICSLVFMNVQHCLNLYQNVLSTLNPHRIWCWIMFGAKRANNLCLWRQNVLIVVSENIVTARKKWSHRLAIDCVAVYVVHTKRCTSVLWIPRFYYVYHLLF